MRTITRRPTTCASCAENCRASFPGTQFYFLPADITTQILNFGLPAPIDIQFESDDVEASTQQANRDARRASPGSGSDRPSHSAAVRLSHTQRDLDRTKAEQGGYTTHDVAKSMLNSLSGSFQITPMFFLN